MAKPISARATNPAARTIAKSCRSTAACWCSKWVDPEVAGRYGIMVLVRCGAEGAAPSRRAPRAPARAPPPAAMSVTIWHNPKCGTSRKVLEAIRARGIEPKIVLYVEDAAERARNQGRLEGCRAFAARPGAAQGTPFNELGLDIEATDAALITAMHDHPILIERPVVITPKGTRLCRPAEKLDEIL